MNKGESYVKAFGLTAKSQSPSPFYSPPFSTFLKTSLAPPKSFKNDEFAKLTALTKICVKLTGGAVAKLTNNFNSPN